MLGDILIDEEKYNLASKAYERAIYISDTISRFYGQVKLYHDDMRDKYKKVLKACMPTQPIHFKLIKCMSNFHDIGQTGRDYAELRKS